MRRRLDEPSSSGGGSVRRGLRGNGSSGVTTGAGDGRGELLGGPEALREDGGGRGIDGGTASELDGGTKPGRDGGIATTGAINADGADARSGGVDAGAPALADGSSPG